MSDLSIADRLVEIRTALVDESLAKQLRRSIERNSRMVTRLQKLEGKIALTNIASPDIFLAVVAIQRDEEPTWPEY